MKSGCPSFVRSLSKEGIKSERFSFLFLFVFFFLTCLFLVLFPPKRFSIFHLASPFRFLTYQTETSNCSMYLIHSGSMIQCCLPELAPVNALRLMYHFQFGFFSLLDMVRQGWPPSVGGGGARDGVPLEYCTAQYIIRYF